ncbi:MAG TPA: hypothetical protein VMC09_05190 [Anaerolineales bacterium]|nr:hypothetical protein [Anaerolineales bacterium]
MNKSGGIIATIAASILCGLPGLGSFCLGLLTVIGAQDPASFDQPGTSPQYAYLGAAFLFCGGTVLIIIPIAVGILTLRRRPEPAMDMTNPYAPTVQPSYHPDLSPAQVYTPPTAASVPQVSIPVQASPASPEDVISRLMGLNRPTAPFRIIDGRSENVDLIAEWKIIDSQWYQVFARANLTRVLRVYMKLDPERREVRAQDREYEVSWQAGIPSLTLKTSVFRGQQSSFSFGLGAGYQENFAPGAVYNYKFTSDEIKGPIQQAIAACGWTYKVVAFGDL